MTEQQEPMRLWLRLHELFNSPEGDGGRHEALQVLVTEEVERETAKLKKLLAEAEDSEVDFCAFDEILPSDWVHDHGEGETSEPNLIERIVRVVEEAEKTKAMREENERLRDAEDEKHWNLIARTATVERLEAKLATAREALIYAKTILHLEPDVHDKLDAAIKEIDREGSDADDA